MLNDSLYEIRPDLYDLGWAIQDEFAVFTPLSIQLRLQWFNRIMKGTHLSMLIKLKKCL
jgi:hypothetical protein